MRFTDYIQTIVEEKELFYALKDEDYEYLSAESKKNVKLLLNSLKSTSPIQKAKEILSSKHIDSVKAHALRKIEQTEPVIKLLRSQGFSHAIRSNKK